MVRPAPAPGDARRPLVWADVAKGSCIALVVLHHLVGKHYVDVLPDDAARAGAAWMTLTYGLKPVRLPLFFLISGFFAASALQRSWSDVWPTRLVNLYYLYALWLCIHAVLFARLRELPMNRTRSGTELVVDLLYASTALWYLYALVAYFAAARLLRPLGHRTVVTAAGALALVTPFLEIDAVNRGSVLQHFVYFVLGAYFPSLVERMARLRVVPVLGLSAAAVLTTVVAPDLGLREGSTKVLVSVAVVPVAVRLAVAVAERPGVARPLALVGRRTLPVYVLHVPVLAVAHLVLAPRAPVDAPGAAGLVWAAYPVLASVALVLACLGLQQALVAVGAGWLFRGPLARPRPLPAPVPAPTRPGTGRPGGPAAATGPDCEHADRAAHRG